jgi:hypothetical protein
MIEQWHSDWVRRKIETTTKLHRDIGGTYGDVVLILTATLSAMAAETWPGRYIDRHRFVQLLMEIDADTKIISIPRLIAGLESDGKLGESELLQQHFMAGIQSSIVLLGSEIDKPETDIHPVVGGSIGWKEIRSYSYASLLYSEVRCSYSHEYRPGSMASDEKMTSRPDACVSYVNIMGERLIHFDLNWIANLCRATARRSDSLAAAGTYPGRPSTWWSDGG